MKNFLYTLLFTPMVLAAQPSGYYSGCENLTDQALLKALAETVGPHTAVSYDALWDVYTSTDLTPDGYIWDMYSTKKFTPGRNKCGNYSSVGDCYNREHSFPKSWFSERAPMKTDAFHVYPTDGKVNGQRSNFPYGECDGGITLTAPSGIRALGRLGASTFPGYSGTVFEPDDQYKGDFARTYFYMAAAYNDQISSFSSPMLAGNAFPVYNTWAINLLLKWHRQDPVSDKETDRNEAVYAIQKNRNPFIDHPELAEYIWGDKKGQRWSESASDVPKIILPAPGATIDFGATVAGKEIFMPVSVKAVNLSAPLAINISGEGFSCPVTSISAADCAKGSEITLNFTPAAREGTYQGSLTLTSGSLTRTVSLSAKLQTTIPLKLPVREVSETSFVIQWTYVGDAADGNYTIEVFDENSEPLPNYNNIKTLATDERFTVDNLDEATKYFFRVSSDHLSSEMAEVTTLAPAPMVDFLFDGELKFIAAVNEISEVAELWVDIRNIDTQVVVSVNEPFQVSADKSSWGTSTSLHPEEDRLYLRMFATTAGTFHGTLTASAGDYFNDETTFTGVATVAGTFLEDFEADASAMGTYSPSVPYQGTAASWTLTNAGIWKETRSHSGTQCLRMGKNSDSKIELTDDYPDGIGTLSVWSNQFNSDGLCKYRVDYSTDHGQTWKTAGEADVDATSWKQHTFVVGTSEATRLRLQQTQGARFMIDDIEARTVSGVADAMSAPYHRWDAYCAGAELVIENPDDIFLTIYALDGTEIAAISNSATLALPTGLYIIASSDFSRRVMVK